MRDLIEAESRARISSTWLRFGPATLIGLAWAKLAFSSNALACCPPAERWMLSANLASVLLLAVPLPLFSLFGQFVEALAVNGGLSLLILADTLHSRFFGDLTSIG